MTKIGLFGAAGRMGRILIKAIHESDKCTLSGGCVKPGSPELGKDLGTLAGLLPLGIEVTDDIGALCQESDVVIDYSAASATMSLIPTAIEKKTPLMIATTGFTESQQTKLVEAGQFVPIILGANMSVSVMAMYELIKTAASMLNDEFDIEIFDFHPWNKIDAPSGTALELGEHAAAGRGVKLSDVMLRARDGKTEKPERGKIGFASLRGGDVVCENTVFFAAPISVFLFRTS